MINFTSRICCVPLPNGRSGIKLFVLENVRSEHGKAVVRIIGHWIDGSLESAKAASAIDGVLERHRRYGGAVGQAARLCVNDGESAEQAPCRRPGSSGRPR